MILEPSSSSGELSVGTTVVCAKPGIVTCIVLHPGSAASSVIVYDNGSSGSGTKVAELLGVASGSSVCLPLPSGVSTVNGITAVVAGTGALAHVLFQRSF